MKSKKIAFGISLMLIVTLNLIPKPVIATNDYTLTSTQSFGGSNFDSFQEVITTSDNGYIAAGASASSDGDMLGLHHFNDDGVIAKYDAAGTVLWKKAFGGDGTDSFKSLAVLPSGEIIAVGQTNSSNGDLIGLNKGLEDALIVKYDASGNLLWKKTFGGSSYDDFNAVAVTSDNGSLVLCSTTSTDGDLASTPNETLVVKYDASGNVLWQKPITSSASLLLESIKTTPDEGFILSGSLSDAVNSYEGYLGKYDSAGNMLWEKTFGGTGDEYFYDVTMTSDGGFAAAGSTNSTDGDLTGLSLGGDDGLVVKYDAAGNVGWKKTFGGTGFDYFKGITVTSDGKLITVGDSDSTNGNLSGFNLGWGDAVVAEYDSSGNLLWNTNFGGLDYDSFNDIAVTSTGLRAAGYSSSTDGNMSGLNKGMNDAIFVMYDKATLATIQASGDVIINASIKPSIMMTLDNNQIQFGHISPVNPTYTQPSVLNMTIQSNTAYHVQALGVSDFIGAVKGQTIPISQLKLKSTQPLYLPLSKASPIELIPYQPAAASMTFPLDAQIQTEWTTIPDDYSGKFTITAASI